MINLSFANLRLDTVAGVAKLMDSNTTVTLLCIRQYGYLP
tara:strand:- start:27 stop:146 length:120 start_codon:yes stop_codon:yes gene_type:complete